MGPLPVEDVLVRDAHSGRTAITGADGQYTLSGVSAQSSLFSATKPGYVTRTTVLAITGDTRLDIQVDRIVTFTLSGVVFEVTSAGRVPIEGVSVYCDSCGSPVGHTFATTDAQGFYSFAWTNNGSTPLIVEKSGFRLPPGIPAGPIGGWIIATVTGNTQFDIELVRQ